MLASYDNLDKSQSDCVQYCQIQSLFTYLRVSEDLVFRLPDSGTVLTSAAKT
jgi:hypothetical protein